MNDIENMTFPTGPVISSVFGYSDVMNPSDIELQGMLDDIGFFEADEESMLLPMTDIKSISQNVSAVSRVSPSSTPDLSFFAKEAATPHESAPISTPVFVSSHDLILPKQLSMPIMSTQTNANKGIPTTVSSSSVASKVFPHPLSPPSYYLATHKFSSSAIPLVSQKISSISPISPRTVISSTTSNMLPPAPIAPATAALAAMTSASGDTLQLSIPSTDPNVKKRRLSDMSSMSSMSWPAANNDEDEMEMKR
jgi:hypothetical protein